MAIPLELRGVVATTDGRVIDVAIGEGDEPKLVINDLLPHLGGEQNKKTLAEGSPASSSTSCWGAALGRGGERGVKLR